MVRARSIRVGTILGGVIVAIISQVFFGNSSLGRLVSLFAIWPAVAAAIGGPIRTLIMMLLMITTIRELFGATTGTTGGGTRVVAPPTLALPSIPTVGTIPGFLGLPSA